MQTPIPSCAGFRRTASHALGFALRGTGTVLKLTGTALVGAGAALQVCGHQLQWLAASRAGIRPQRKTVRRTKAVSQPQPAA